MAHNLKDNWGWVDRLIRRVDRLEVGGMLENSSITNGRLRFIGGVLRLDSGALLELIGQWRFFGNGSITGDVVAEGKWTQNGPWEFNGDGEIDGDVAVTGTLEVTGTGRAKIGTAMTLDPSDTGGAIRFTTGASITGGQGGIAIQGAGGSSGPMAYITATLAALRGSSTSLVIADTDRVTLMFAGTQIRLSAGGMTLVGVRSAPKAGISSGGLWLDADGTLCKAP